MEIIFYLLIYWIIKFENVFRLINRNILKGSTILLIFFKKINYLIFLKYFKKIHILLLLLFLKN